jgi:hypothetical protein
MQYGILCEIRLRFPNSTGFAVAGVSSFPDTHLLDFEFQAGPQSFWKFGGLTKQYPFGLFTGSICCHAQPFAQQFVC